MTTATTTYAELHNAVAAIASVCDGANDRDDAGFNGTDAKFGHRIAAIPADQWTHGQAVEVSEMLPKYARQLASMGIDASTLPYVKGERDVNARQDARRTLANTPYAIVRDGEIRVYNSFNIKDALKSAGYRFAGLDKAWTAKVSQATAAKVIELGVDLRDGAEQITAASTAPVVVDTRPKGTVHYDSRNDLIVITSEYGLIPLDVMRSLPGRKWDGYNKVNTCFPESVVLELAETYGLEVSPLAYTAITSAVARLAASSATEVANYAGALSGTLRGYQEAGTQYAIDNPHSINADDMGLGKTLQTIAAAESKGLFPILVTCPASLRANWVREVAKWTPHRTAEVWDGKGEAPNTDYVIVSYEAMTKAVQNSL